MITRLPPSCACLSVALLVCWIVPGAIAQTPVDLTSSRQQARLSTLAVFQSYQENGADAIDQLSFPVSVDLPLSRSWRITAWGHQMSTTGDGIAEVTGLADAQFILSYARRIGSSSIVVSTGLNAPTGKRELTAGEFETLVVLSQSAFDYRVPSLGQGLGVSPALTWAFPVSRNVVFGLGASYQYHGGFKPVDYLTEDYTPGDELLLTAGLDVRLSPTSAFSLDLTHALYAADKLGEVEVYESGDKSTATALLRGYAGFQEWRLLVFYRSRAKSDELAGTTLVTEAERTLPNELGVRASFRARMGSAVHTEFLAQARFFDETEVYPKREVFDLGALPTVRLSSSLSLTSRFVYTLGTITGFEAGAGLLLEI